MPQFVEGTGGVSIFGERLIRFDEGSRGIYRVSSPDVISPRNDAIASLQISLLQQFSHLRFRKSQASTRAPDAPWTPIQ